MGLGVTACSSSPASTDDAGAGDADVDAPADATADAGNMCSAALSSVLKPVDKVSTGVVSVVSDTNGVKTVYLDASAGSFALQDQYPRTYVNLETATRVDVTDVQAPTSTGWDLAFKRPVIFTNDGDGGPGQGGLLTVAKAFDQVTAADATGTFATESFVDADCNPKTDATGEILTTMSDWYDYDQQTNTVTPKPGTTFIVRGATGKLYKVAILSFYGRPDGGTGGSQLAGEYLIEVAGL